MIQLFQCIWKSKKLQLLGIWNNIWKRWQSHWPETPTLFLFTYVLAWPAECFLHFVFYFNSNMDQWSEPRQPWLVSNDRECGAWVGHTQFSRHLIWLNNIEFCTALAFQFILRIKMWSLIPMWIRCVKHYKVHTMKNTSQF